MVIYKQNLALIQGPYGDLERRILNLFSREPERQDIWLLDDLSILIDNLLANAILVESGSHEIVAGEHALVRKRFSLTEYGQGFIGR